MKLVAAALCGVVVASSSATGGAPASPIHACTLAPFGRLKSDSHPYFIGVPLTDTIVVGPGETIAVGDRGHFGRRGEGQIFGQMVRVEKWGEARAVASLTNDTAVIVPWDYDASCQTTTWGGSWRWLASGSRKFMSPHLRPQAHWVGAYPTFDAFAPHLDAYPASQADPVFPRPDKRLTDQLFDLFQLVPSSEQIEALGWPAVEEAFRWARAHTTLASTYPADEIGRRLTMAAGESHVRKLAIPVAGTYRMTLTFPSGSRRQFFLRTADRAWGAWYVSRQFKDPEEHPIRAWSKQLDGYQLAIWIAAREEALPVRPEYSTRYDYPLGVREAADTIGGELVWRAEFEVSGLDRLELPQDAELDSLMAIHYRWFEASWDAGTLVGDPGTFVRNALGLTFEQPIPLLEGRSIRIHGDRVSSRTVRDTVP